MGHGHGGWLEKDAQRMGNEHGLGARCAVRYPISVAKNCPPNRLCRQVRKMKKPK